MFYGEVIASPVNHSCLGLSGMTMNFMLGKSAGHSTTVLLLSLIHKSTSSEGNADRTAERCVAESDTLFPSRHPTHGKLSCACLFIIMSEAFILT